MTKGTSLSPRFDTQNTETQKYFLCLERLDNFGTINAIFEETASKIGSGKTASTRPFSNNGYKS